MDNAAVPGTIIVSGDRPTFGRGNYVNRLRLFAIRNDSAWTVPITVEMPYVVPFID